MSSLAPSIMTTAGGWVRCVRLVELARQSAEQGSRIAGAATVSNPPRGRGERACVQRFVSSAGDTREEGELMTATASDRASDRQIEARSTALPVTELQIEYRRAEAAALALPRRRPLTRLVAISEVRKRAARAADSVLEALSAMDGDRRAELISDEARTSLYEFARTYRKKSKIRPASLALKATHGLLPFLGVTGGLVGALAHSAHKLATAIWLVFVYAVILQLIGRALAPGRTRAREAIGAPAAVPLVRRKSRPRVQPASAYLAEVRVMRSVGRRPLPDWPTDLLIKAGGAVVPAILVLGVAAEDRALGSDQAHAATVAALVIAALAGLRVVWLVGAAVRRVVLRARVRSAATGT